MRESFPAGVVSGSSAARESWSAASSRSGCAAKRWRPACGSTPGDRDAAATGRRLLLTLAGRLLAPEDVTRLQSLGIFDVNTDRNRYLEYATPRYNLVRMPLEAINLRLLSRYASFAAPVPDPAWPEAFRPGVRLLTPELQREVLGVVLPPAGR